MAADVFIGLGANEGNKIDTLRKAVKKVAKLNNTTVTSSSSVYESMAFGKTDQPDFVNAVIKVKTELEPHTLLSNLKKIESDLGRKKVEKWGPRNIDLDILIYGDLVFSDEIISLPHKGLLKRDFVLLPLLEIDPFIKNPENKQPLSLFLDKLTEKNVFNKLSQNLLTEEQKVGKQ